MPLRADEKQPGSERRVATEEKLAVEKPAEPKPAKAKPAEAKLVVDLAGEESEDHDDGVDVQLASVKQSMTASSITDEFRRLDASLQEALLQFCNADDGYLQEVLLQFCNADHEYIGG